VRVGPSEYGHGQGNASEVESGLPLQLEGARKLQLQLEVGSSTWGWVSARSADPPDPPGPPLALTADGSAKSKSVHNYGLHIWPVSQPASQPARSEWNGIV